MSSGLMARVAERMTRKVVQKAIDSRLAEEVNNVLVSYKIRPKDKEIFHTEQEVQAHMAGYSDGRLNDYIVAKSARWLDGVQLREFVLPPHVYSLLFVINLVQSRLAVPARILDFGGGAPTFPLLLRQSGVQTRYKIVESPAFVSKVPAAWRELCEYADTYSGEACDLLVLSSVLPYLPKSLTQSVYDAIRRDPPRFIYFGRTSFLADDYPHDQAFTIQESRFREHGAQVDVGMADIENNMARYVKRHFKWGEVAAVLDPLGYERVLALSDDSGLENIKGLGLHTNNSLWERRGAHAG